MPTSDGISDADWAILVSRIADIVNVHEQANEQSIEAPDTTLLTGVLMRYLRQLEDKYGRLASLVETQADFSDDRRDQLMLHREAYAAALEQRDHYYLTAASKSLAALYLQPVDPTPDSGEEIKASVDIEKGRFWLEKFSDHMKYCSDDLDHQDYDEMTKRLDDLSKTQT